MSKVPKFAQQPQVQKKPANVEDPIIFKDTPVSWQLHRIDDEGPWGTNVFRKRKQVKINDDLLESDNKVSEELKLALIELMGKEFETTDSFYEELQKKLDQDISIEEQKLIFKQFEENVFWTEVYPKLVHFETTTWLELEKEMYGSKRRRTKHHAIEISKIISEARTRLEELKIEDIDELFSIRLTGKIRVWGMRKKSYFQVLWFDLKHEICPSKKK